MKSENGIDTIELSIRRYRSWASEGIQTITRLIRRPLIDCSQMRYKHCTEILLPGYTMQHTENQLYIYMVKIKTNNNDGNRIRINVQL